MSLKYLRGNRIFKWLLLFEQLVYKLFHRKKVGSINVIRFFLPKIMQWRSNYAYLLKFFVPKSSFLHCNTVQSSSDTRRKTRSDCQSFYSFSLRWNYSIVILALFISVFEWFVEVNELPLENNVLSFWIFCHKTNCWIVAFTTGKNFELP